MVQNNSIKDQVIWKFRKKVFLYGTIIGKGIINLFLNIIIYKHSPKTQKQPKNGKSGWKIKLIDRNR